MSVYPLQLLQRYSSYLMDTHNTTIIVASDSTHYHTVYTYTVQKTHSTYSVQDTRTLIVQNTYMHCTGHMYIYCTNTHTVHTLYRTHVHLLYKNTYTHCTGNMYNYCTKTHTHTVQDTCTFIVQKHIHTLYRTHVH